MPRISNGTNSPRLALLYRQNAEDMGQFPWGSMHPFDFIALLCSITAYPTSKIGFKHDIIRVISMGTVVQRTFYILPSVMLHYPLQKILVI